MNRKGSLHLSTHQLDGQVIIEFQDSGPGIPEIVSMEIFKPFFSTKQATQGSGLGLYITRTIIESLGGEIEVDSKEGERLWGSEGPSPNFVPLARKFKRQNDLDSNAILG